MFWRKKKPVEEIVIEAPNEEPKKFYEVKEDGIEIVEGEPSSCGGVWTVRKCFYEEECRPFISRDGSVFMVAHTEEEHTCLDPRETKENDLVYKNRYLRTLELETGLYTGCWSFCGSSCTNAYVETNRERIQHKLIDTITPLEKFQKENYEYYLIDTEKEFQEYLDSEYSIKVFCDLKLYNTLKNFGLEDDYISDNAWRIGHDLQKYRKLLEIINASENDLDKFKFLFKRTFVESGVVSGVTIAPCCI